MSKRNGYAAYKKTQVESAGREKILLMLYEGAIRFTKRAMQAVDEKDIASRGENIGKVYDIVMELNNTLDHKVGGELAANLEQLYMFMTDELTKANVQGSKEPLKVVLDLLETLYEGWVQAVEKLKKEQNNAG